MGASPSVAEVSEAELSPQQRQPRTAFAGFNDPLLNQVGRLRPPGGQQQADDLLRGDATSLSETGSRRSPRQPLASISGANTLPHSTVSSSNLASVGAKSGSLYEKPSSSSHFSADTSLLEPTYPPLPGLSVTTNTPHWANLAATRLPENGLQYPAVSSGAEYRVAQGGNDQASSPTAQPSYPSPSSSYPPPPHSNPSPSSNYPSPPPSNPATQPSYPYPLPSYPSPLPSYPTTQPSYPSPQSGYPSPQLIHPAPYPQTTFSTSPPSYAASQTGYPPPQPSYPTPQPSFTTAQPSYPTHQPSYPTHAPNFPTPEPSYPAPQPSYAIPQPNYPAPQSHYSSTQPSYQGGQPSGAQLKTHESPFLNSGEEDELQRLSLGKITKPNLHLLLLHFYFD